MTDADDAVSKPTRAPSIRDMLKAYEDAASIPDPGPMAPLWVQRVYVARVKGAFKDVVSIPPQEYEGEAAIDALGQRAWKGSK